MNNIHPDKHVHWCNLIRAFAFAVAMERAGIQEKVLVKRESKEFFFIISKEEFSLSESFIGSHLILKLSQ